MVFLSIIAFDLHDFTRGREFTDFERDLVLSPLTPSYKMPLFFTSLSSQKQIVHSKSSQGFSYAKLFHHVRSRDKYFA